MNGSVRVSLKIFIETGSFGLLELGAPRSVVEEWLDRPEQWNPGADLYQQAAIWKYGDVELHFNNHLLCMIFLDDFTVPSGGSRIDLEPWIISEQLSCAQAEHHLASASISYRKADFPFVRGGVHLTTSAGVVLAFGGVEESGPTLYSLHHQAVGHT